MIDRLYGDLLALPDVPDEPSDPAEASAESEAVGLVVFLSPRVLAGQACVAGAEAA